MLAGRADAVWVCHLSGSEAQRTLDERKAAGWNDAVPEAGALIGF
jgi:hypothetical protein